MKSKVRTRQEAGTGPVETQLTFVFTPVPSQDPGQRGLWVISELLPLRLGQWDQL